MDPTIKGVVIGGLIAAGAGVATQVVAHMLERRGRKVDEIRRVAPAFVDAVYSVRVRLDEIVRVLTALLIGGKSPDDAQKWRDDKSVAMAQELDADRATELNVRLWQVQVACGGDAASTAETIVDRLDDYFREANVIRASTLVGNWARVHKGGDKCRALSKEVEDLLRRFAEEVRATTERADDLS